MHVNMFIWIDKWSQTLSENKSDLVSRTDNENSASQLGYTEGIFQSWKGQIWSYKDLTKI